MSVDAPPQDTSPSAPLSPRPDVVRRPAASGFVRLARQLPSSFGLVATGWVVTAGALCNFWQFRDTFSLWIMTAGLVLVVLAVVRLCADAAAPAPEPVSELDRVLVPSRALTASLAAACGLILPAAGFIYGTPGHEANAVHNLGTIAAALAVVVSLTRRKVLGSLGFAAVLVIWVVGSCLTIKVSPMPTIDVWFLLQSAADQLRHGADLFSSCWPGNTDPRTTCVYAYMPWTTVSQLPAYLILGDVRYTYVLTMGISAVLVWRLGGPQWGATLAVLLLMQPRWFFMLEQAWTEPLLIFGLTVMVWGAITGRNVWSILGLAFALACKQHLVMVLPLAWIWPRFGPRRTIYATLLAVAGVAPFALRNPSGFYDDVVGFHLNQVPRADSLSFYGLAERNGVEVPFIVVPLVMALTLGLILIWMPRTDTGFVLGSAVLLFVFNIINKASFFNHYSLVLWMLVLVLVTEARRLSGQDAPDDPGEPDDSTYAPDDSGDLQLAHRAPTVDAGQRAADDVGSA